MHIVVYSPVPFSIYGLRDYLPHGALRCNIIVDSLKLRAPVPPQEHALPTVWEDEMDGPSVVASAEPRHYTYSLRLKCFKAPIGLQLVIVLGSVLEPGEEAELSTVGPQSMYWTTSGSLE